MIALDSSALVAILRGEAESASFVAIIANADRCFLSSVSLLETSMVLAGRGGSSASWIELDELIEQAGLEVVPQDAAQVGLARQAFLQFGKGRHPAALNFGDCAAYALAKARSLPLLFKGEDFARTDLTAAA